MEHYSVIECHLQRRGQTQRQSEVSQTEKNKYCIIPLTKVESGIQKTGTDELVCKSETETQMQRKHDECQGWEEDELGDWDN